MQTINIDSGESVSFGFEINGIDTSDIIDFSVCFGNLKYSVSTNSISKDISNQRLYIVKIPSIATSKLNSNNDISYSLITDFLGVYKENKISILKVTRTNENTSLPKTSEFIKATFIINVVSDVVTTNIILQQIYSSGGSEIGFTPENIDNKSINFSIVDDIKYPSVKAVKEYLDSKYSGMNYDTIDFYNKTLVSGGTIKQSDLIAIDNFITSGKQNGWWEAQKDMCLYLKTNGGVNSAIVKLKNTTNTNITNYNYTDSDVNDFGLFAGESLNSSKYLDLGVSMSALGVDLQNLSTSIFTPLEGSRDYRFNIGDSNNKLGAVLSLFVNSNTVTPFILACNNSDEVGAYSETNQPLGVNVITCRNDGLTSFNNGVNYVDTKDVGSGIIDGTFEASRRSYGGGNVFYGNIPLSFYSIGTSLTNKQSTDMSKDIYNLMLELGRISTTNSLLSFGDSILKGFLESDITKIYSNQVARKLALNNLNMSRGERISSTSSGDVLPALSVYPNLLDFAPKTSTVLFALGTNDILSLDSNSNDFGDPANLANFNNYCGAMFQQSIDVGQNIIIVSIARITSDFVNVSLNKQLDYVKVSANLAKETFNKLNAIKVNFINLYHFFLDSDVNYLLPDGVHFNQEGNLAASKEVMRVISTGAQRRNILLSFGNIAAGASVDISVTVLNAEVGMTVTVSPPNNLIDGLTLTAFVSSDDNVVVRLTNVTGSDIVVSDGKFIIDVKTGY